MIEIVFSDSAFGALRVAQTYGKGEYRSGCIGVILSKGDGTEPTQEEIDAEIQRYEEQERRKWKSAVPLGGDKKDVL